MPIVYLRHLSGRDRSSAANRQLAFPLTLIAGAINAGGYLAVKQYTSHMSGIVSSMADNTALGNLQLVGAGFAALLSFLAGASCSAILVNWGRRRQLQSEYASPLMVEAGLLLCFGLMGRSLMPHQGLFLSVVVMLLCFMMGLQNALITKLSHAEIRTTHITGIVTDIGIEVGKYLYWNSATADVAPVLADREKLKLLTGLLATFFVGGLVGALGFKYAGFVSTVPLAMLLVMLAAVPIADDVGVALGRE